MQDVPANRFAVHPEYVHDDKTVHDLGLALLPQPFVMTSHVTQACVPPFGAVFKGMATIAGWGKTDEFQSTDALWNHASGRLRTADVNLLSPDKCTNPDYFGKFDARDSLCAGFPSGAKDSCTGDSGGPLMSRIGDQTYVIGVVSYGFGCGRRDRPGIYVRVARHRPWIDAVVRYWKGIPDPARPPGPPAWG